MGEAVGHEGRARHNVRVSREIALAFQPERSDVWMTRLWGIQEAAACIELAEVTRHGGEGQGSPLSVRHLPNGGLQRNIRSLPRLEWDPLGKDDVSTQRREAASERGCLGLKRQKLFVCFLHEPSSSRRVNAGTMFSSVCRGRCLCVV